MKAKMVIYIVLATLFLRCSNANKPNPVANTATKEVVLFDSVISPKKDSLTVFFKKDSVFFKHTNDVKSILSVPWKEGNYYPSENLKGLYIVNENLLVKTSVIELNNMILFTIFDELYRGELYAIRFNKKSFLKDISLKRDYISCASGIYILDEKRNRIITVDKPILDEKADTMTTPFRIYELSEQSFDFIASIKYKGELIYSDSLIIQFYNKYQKANGKWHLIKN